MDYNLAAMKLLCGALKDARQSPSSSSASTLYGILFQRAWLQGVLVSDSDDGGFILDDGSGIVKLSMSLDFNGQKWVTGMYVLVIGLYIATTVNLPLIKVHKIVDLSSSPDREAMWYLEVIEAYKLFYKSFPEE
ncbi:hypothetical protein QJS04_geneDACA020091 [Acorus gramineus]|uniref:RecQ-mediated genome instability protein 2 n=1 Tax=Acorus gramineus TaxID=55184 RepID=A0AAV9A5W5_ACOGR|nr:hypothetical protein QJS04_geneDACA020091 [Acorus gramineus]